MLENDCIMHTAALDVDKIVGFDTNGGSHRCRRCRSQDFDQEDHEDK